VNDVFIGDGNLAGNGVYAARDFHEGELVIRYDLRELDQQEFDALPPSEHEWVHSFWGRMHLFAEPARYVNNADAPSTYPDLLRRGNYALRSIKRGEAITIDDSIELQHELDTFLEAYEKSVDSGDFDQLRPLIADDATFWFAHRRIDGIDAVLHAFEETAAGISEHQCTLSDVRWHIATYRHAACSFVSLDGHGTSVLKRLRGSWRIVHSQLSSP
jgi:ketosteroid isomerase-like protein